MAGIAPQKTACDTVRYVKENCKRFNPDLVLQCVLKYAKSVSAERLIHVGEEKGVLLDEMVVSHDPTTILEMGAYFGYSAVRMARLLKKPGAKVYSMEINKECADASMELVRHCGLSERVEIFNKAAADGIANFQSLSGADHVDFVFMDHWKDLYLSDLKKLEASGLLRPGAVIVADNMISPGVPDYLDYVSNSPTYKTTLHTFKFSEDDAMTMSEDAVAVSIYQGVQK